MAHEVVVWNLNHENKAVSLFQQVKKKKNILKKKKIEFVV